MYRPTENGPKQTLSIDLRNAILKPQAEKIFLFLLGAMRGWKKVVSRDHFCQISQSYTIRLFIRTIGLKTLRTNLINHE